MTQEEAAMIWPLLKAYEEGKKIQMKSKNVKCDEWRNIEYPSFDSFQFYDYRIKSEPSYRPWTPDEYPIGAIYRSLDHKIHGVIQRKGDNLFIANHIFEAEEILKSQGNCSKDGGKTWNPCGTLIE